MIAPLPPTDLPITTTTTTPVHNNILLLQRGGGGDGHLQHTHTLSPHHPMYIQVGAGRKLQGFCLYTIHTDKRQSAGHSWLGCGAHVSLPLALSPACAPMSTLADTKFGQLGAWHTYIYTKFACRAEQVCLLGNFSDCGTHTPLLPKGGPGESKIRGQI